MQFATIVFTIAGVWGLVVLTPLYFLVDISGQPWPAPTSYPHFFYGFLGLAFAWQLAFLLIARDPVRYRLLMIPAIVEKFGFVATAAVLYNAGRISATDASVAAPDLLLGLLFVAAFLKTPR